MTTGPNLLSIPKELRLQICEYVLVGGLVQITQNLKPPGLLSTCRQIREESSKIWYLRNMFYLLIHNCDPKLLFKWSKFIDAGHICEPRMPPPRLKLSRAPNWTNLLVWCKDWYNDSGGLPLLEPSKRYKTGQEILSVVATAHEYIRQSKRNKEVWKECEQTLRGLRKVAGVMNTRWLDDP